MQHVPGILVTNLRRGGAHRQVRHAGLNFGKADLENYSVTQERLLRGEERFLQGQRMAGTVHAFHCTQGGGGGGGGKRFLSEPDADVTVSVRSRVSRRTERHRYGDGGGGGKPV